jgi:hypothetical protein
VYPVQLEDATDFQLVFSFEQGGYKNQVSGQVGYTHEAAAAKFSRKVASKYYDVEPQGIYGYIYGGSGGSMQTVGVMENTEGIPHGRGSVRSRHPNQHAQQLHCKSCSVLWHTLSYKVSVSSILALAAFQYLPVG